MTKRKFYKTTVVVKVLSDEDIGDLTLEQIAHEIMRGGMSGEFKVTQIKTLNGKQAARALKAQGSDPEFFGLNDKGESIY